MESAEVVIVGGGIVGTNIAFTLALRGVRDVVLLEARQLAAGGTGRSSGILRQFYLHPFPVEMARDGLTFYSNFRELVGEGDVSFVRSGLVVGGGEIHRGSFEHTARLQRERGATTRVVEFDELRLLMPSVAADDLTCALYEPESGYADPSGACLALAHAASVAGVRVRQRVAVTGIRIDARGVAAVETTAGTITTRIVVDAAGPWADRIARLAGVALPIEASRHQVISVRRPPELHGDQPVYSDPFNLIYTRPETGEQLLIGSTDPTDHDDVVDPDTSPSSADDDEIADLVERGMRRFPALVDSNLVAGWSGIYDVTPDGFPIVDRLHQPEGFVIAAGLSGHGFKLSHAIGRMVTSLILDADPEPSARVLRLSRFSEGEPIDSPTTTTLTSMKAHSREPLSQ